MKDGGGRYKTGKFLHEKRHLLTSWQGFVGICVSAGPAVSFNVDANALTAVSR